MTAEAEKLKKDVRDSVKAKIAEFQDDLCGYLVGENRLLINACLEDIEYCKRILAALEEPKVRGKANG